MFGFNSLYLLVTNCNFKFLKLQRSVGLVPVPRVFLSICFLHNQAHWFSVLLKFKSLYFLILPKFTAISRIFKFAIIFSISEGV